MSPNLIAPWGDLPAGPGSPFWPWQNRNSKCSSHYVMKLCIVSSTWMIYQQWNLFLTYAITVSSDEMSIIEWNRPCFTILTTRFNLSHSFLYFFPFSGPRKRNISPTLAPFLPSRPLQPSLPRTPGGPWMPWTPGGPWMPWTPCGPWMPWTPCGPWIPQ